MHTVKGSIEVLVSAVVAVPLSAVVRQCCATFCCGAAMLCHFLLWCGNAVPLSAVMRQCLLWCGNAVPLCTQREGGREGGRERQAETGSRKKQGGGEQGGGEQGGGEQGGEKREGNTFGFKYWII